jgi:hypothetical protein
VFLLRSTNDRDWLLGRVRDLANHRVSKFTLRQVEWTEFSTNCPSILWKLFKKEGSQQIVYEHTDADGRSLHGRDMTKAGWSVRRRSRRLRSPDLNIGEMARQRSKSVFSKTSRIVEILSHLGSHSSFA